MPLTDRSARSGLCCRLAFSPRIVEAHEPMRVQTFRSKFAISSAAWMIWHGYDLSALLFLAPLLSSRRQQNGSSRRNGRVGAAATKLKRRNVRSDHAVDRPLESYSWPV
jgi:hypothetical protein